MSEYIMHITLDTGHGRRSYRDETDPAAVTILAQMLAEARAGEAVEIRSGYSLKVAAEGSALVATLVSNCLGPLATIGVARKSRDSAKLWGLLRSHLSAIGDAPSVPWCAAKLYPSLNADPAAQRWLGDFERLLAWAWLMKGESLGGRK